MKRTNKSLTSIALILLFVSSALLLTQTVNAHSPSWNIPTYAYLSASPTTTGVNQYVVLVMWLNTVVPTAGGTGGDAWRNFYINVTDPAGSKSTLGPFTSGQVGTTFTTFTPTQVGKYTMVFYWPGQILTNGTQEPNFRGLAYVGDFFMPAVSAPFVLTVNQAPDQLWQEPPLPTNYWTLPITDMNRAWSVLASNWLGGAWLVNSVQTEGLAPNSAHIVWNSRIINGGIPDAQWPGQPYNNNDYDSPFGTPIIMNGRVYINSPVDAETTKYGYYCLDLQTGQQIWYKNGTDNGLNQNNLISLVGYASGLNTAPALSQTFPQLSFGQLYHYNSVNGQGVTSYLWMTSGSSWYMLEAETGNWIMTLKNVPGGTAVVDQDGSLLRYSYNAATGNLLCWNSSQSIPPAGPTGTSQQQWKPRVGATIDAVNDTSWTVIGPVVNQWDAVDIAPRSGYTMNVTIAKNLPVGPPSLTNGLPSPGAGSMSVIQDANRVPQYIFGFRNWDAVASTTGGSGTFAAWCVKINYGATSYSPNPTKTFSQNNNLGYTATLLYNINYTGPLAGNLTWNLGPIDYATGIWTLFSKETMQWFGYKISDGSKAWGPTDPEISWDMYGDNAAISNGNLYTCGYGGILYSYNVATGSLNWKYTAANIGDESPYGNYPLNIGAIADGKVFLYSTEHSPTKPLWRGSMVRAIDANNGTEIWKINDFNMGLAVASGYLLSGNAYDNKLYCYGKGQSATTIVASPKVQAKGSQILLEGTVTDQSPGAPGTPAIADKYMQQWMEYLYMQQAIPTSATGVPVHLTAIDPNGNLQDIGTTTTDISGNYALMWTPPVEGKYMVTASFAGTYSYWPSSEETAFGVTTSPAAIVTPTQTPTTTSTVTPTPSAIVTPTPTTPQGPAGIPTSTMFAIAAAAIIIVIVAAAAIALRRRK